MARIRSIKPEYPKDEIIGTQPRDVRYLFVLLWTLADDDGLFRASPALIRSELYPYDEDLTQHRVSEWLTALGDCGRVRFYSVGGQQYGQIVNFLKHQRIERPTPSKLPPPPDGLDSENPPRALTDDSPSHHRGLTVGGEGKGREGSGGESGSGDRSERPLVLTSPATRGPSPEAVAKLWNEVVGKRLPNVRDTSLGDADDRRKRIRDRSKPERDLDWWRKLFEKSAASSFLCGGGPRGWKADFDFVIRSEQCIRKILEGGYDDSPRATSKVVAPSRYADARVPPIPPPPKDSET